MAKFFMASSLSDRLRYAGSINHFRNRKENEQKILPHLWLPRHAKEVRNNENSD